MKVIIKNLATLLLCLTATLAIGNSGPGVTVVGTDEQSIAVYVNHAGNKTVQIGLKDAQGFTLLNDRVKNETSFARKYNLENLPAGEYTLFVEQGNKTTIQPVSLTNDGIFIPEGSASNVFAPAILVADDKVDFTMLCLNDAEVTIRIVDELGRDNYVATTHEKGSVQRRFDISALDAGRYTIITSLDGQNFDKVYSESFTLGEEVAGN